MAKICVVLLLVPLWCRVALSGYSNYDPDNSLVFEMTSLSTLDISLIKCVNLCHHSFDGTRIGLRGCQNQCNEGGDQHQDQIEESEVEKGLFQIDMVCRTDTRISLEIHRNTTWTDDFRAGFYVMQVQGYNSTKVVASPLNRFHLNRLISGTEYHLTGFVMSTKNMFEYLIDLSYLTLPENHKPAPITDLSVDEFFLDQRDINFLDVMLNWVVPSDRLCFYEIHWYSAQDDHQSDMNEHSTEIVEYTPGPERSRVNFLKFGLEYEIAINSQNDRDNPSQQSEVIWHTITVPSCLEWFSYNLDICAPPTPEKLKIQSVKFIASNIYDISVTWKQPKSNPCLYEIELLDFDEDLGPEQDPVRYAYNISGNHTSYKFSGVEIRGHAFQVDLVAFSKAGTSYAFVMRNFDKFDPESLSQSVWAVPVLVLLPLAILIIFLMVSFYMYRQRKKARELEDTCRYLANVEHSSGHLPEDDDCTLTKLSHLNELNKLEMLQKNVTIDDSMELERDQIELLSDLGEGAFGLVKQGLVDLGGNSPKIVAIKMLKHSPTMNEIIEFRREIDVMKSVGAHPNIVSIIGHYTKQLDELMLLTEYCCSGSLLDYLRNFWNAITNEKCFGEDGLYAQVMEEANVNAVVNEGYGLSEEMGSKLEEVQVPKGPKEAELPNSTEKILTKLELLHFARQIASGMEFLSKNKVIHRDLAARNVLVCENNVVKIADFGLSRDIYQNNVYKKKTNGKLPIKWLAIESLAHQIYTTQSDVWSYGILFYEIMTFGCTPYPSISNECLLDMLKNGYRMEQPMNCCIFIFELMLSCWHCNPNQRPTFSAIIEQLNGLIINCQLDEDGVQEQCKTRFPAFDRDDIVRKPQLDLDAGSYLIPDEFII